MVSSENVRMKSGAQRLNNHPSSSTNRDRFLRDRDLLALAEMLRSDAYFTADLDRALSPAHLLGGWLVGTCKRGP